MIPGLESEDRRLFLRGFTLTSAGLVLPRKIISIPAVSYQSLAYYGGRIDIFKRSPIFLEYVMRFNFIYGKPSMSIATVVGSKK